MRVAVAVIALIAAPISAVAAEIDVKSTIDTVTVYPDGATATRLIRLDLPAGDSTLVARDFPLSLNVASLRVEGEGAGKLTIGSIDTRRPHRAPPVNLPEIDKRIEALKDERGVLDDKIAAAAARRKFAVRFAETSPAGLGEKGEARPLSEWRAAFAAVAEEVAAADADIRAAKRRQREIDRELARLNDERQARPPRKMEVRIDLSASTAAPALLRVTYSVRGARWLPLYDARLDSGARERKASLALVRRAEIVQSTGEDWTDVALSVSTVRTARGGNAPELHPLIVRYPQPLRPVAGTRRDQMEAAAPQTMSRAAKIVRSPVPAQEREATIETGGFQVVFHIPGRVSVSASEGARSFRIATAQIEPVLAVRSVPVLDDTAFLEATFKQSEEAPLLPGRIALYRDGIYVGRSRMKLTPKDETARLGFGADEMVKVTRATMRRTEGTAGLIASSKTEEREFKITVRNGHDFPIRVHIEDRLPVSENEDIKVEMLPSTTPPTARDLRDRRGVLEWSYEAAPGTMREITFGWQLRWPKDKSIIYLPRRP